MLSALHRAQSEAPSWWRSAEPRSKRLLRLATTKLTVYEVNSMAFITASKKSVSVKAYIGDKKTMLAFNFSSRENAKNLAGFTIFCQPPGEVPGYYLQND